MRFFNDIIDIGQLDPWLMSALNLLVGIHILAFFIMLFLIIYSWVTQPEDAFRKEV